MMKLLNSLKTSKSGASAAEYALIVAVLGGIVVAASITLGGGITTAMGESAAVLEGASTAQ